MTTAATKRLSVPDQIFLRLCEQILTGRYAPGDALPTQRRMALEFDANLATVREAIGRLEQMNLVEVRQGAAMTVLDWRKHGGLDVVALALMRAGELDQKMLSSVLEARRLLLSESARIAAVRRTDAQVARLVELAEAIAAEPDDLTAQQLDFAFYEELVEAANNVVFMLIMNTVRGLYMAGGEFYREVVADREEMVPLYREIADAVRDRKDTVAADTTLELVAIQEMRLRAALQ